jgi:hypothetical protein
LLAAVIAVPVLFGLIALFHLPRIRTEKASPAAPPTIGLMKATDSRFKDEARFRDPTPLFLPTEWNATEASGLVAAPRERGGTFQSFSPKLTFRADELDLNLPSPVTVPTRPTEAFSVDKPDRPFLGFGQRDQALPPLAQRGAFVDVRKAGSGEQLMAMALPDARPPGEGNWQPLEFLVAVNPAGLVRPAVLVESSHVTDVDEYFEEYLARQLQIGQRLRPGFYRVSFGP